MISRAPTSRLLLAAVSALLAPSVVVAAEALWQAGARVIVDKAGAGHRAVVLRAEPSRAFVAYEGADEAFDEWVENDRIRSARPRVEPPKNEAEKNAPETAESAATPVPEPLPRALELPRPARDAVVATAWLEQMPRTAPDAPVRFNTATLPVPQFAFGPTAGIATAQPPVHAVLLYSGNRIRGFAAIENGIVLYGRDNVKGFKSTGTLDLSSLGGFTPEVLVAGDLNHDGETDLVVAAGPLLQVFFGSADGVFVPTLKPYRSTEPLRAAATGRFFTGALGWGVAVVEGYDRFRLLQVAQSGVTPMGDPYTVKFDRITRLAAGDFDGDGFADIAVTTEDKGRCTGAWMFFNQHGATKPFLWPVGGRDDFARDVVVADLDRDGRDDLILTDNDVERGERIRVVFGASGRAGWEDPWELVASEFGLGLGTASVVVADFNHDGRLDIGIGGRNGLRVYLGADYRRFSRNPVWPRLATGNDFPEQRVFLAGDFDGDGAADLLGYTPVFATGYNLVYNATPLRPDGVHVPAPLKERAVAQASTTVTKIEGPRSDLPEGAPVLRHLASRAEPYGQWRYRIVLEVAALADNAVIESLEAICRYDSPDAPTQEIAALVHRDTEQQWSIEVTLPRGRTYEFRINAKDDKGRAAAPLRVTVNP
ncbi:MAG: VCBS repeat-containing protein [Candidatus Didemnitutus sp.]|nr:VCBS repeat-containing protein [Candidatus Didemnitutus sp.]